MKENHREVVKLCLNDLITDLEVAAEAFFDHMRIHNIISLADRQNIYNKTSSNRGRLDELLLLIPGKDNGWKAMISYLNDNNFGSLANKLQNSLKELENSSNSKATTKPAESKTFVEKDFIDKLTDYYRSQYSKVRTMFGDPRDVDEIWVPLRLVRMRNSRQKGQSFSHLQLLERLADKESYSVALISGHPGVGKTTLVQKIAYDWATKKAVQFDLILTVPLRYVGKATDFLDLAVNYYTKRLQVLPGCKEELIQGLKALDKKLLICFDGLDEYSSLAESPFKAMFTHSFQPSRPNNNQCPTPLIPYKLLITSRPYACESIEGDFSPLRFEICPLAEAYLADFVAHCCETEEARMKVSKYLENYSGLVIQVPLILTFVCYLAELREEIPTNLSLLYDKLLGHMVKREIRSVNRLAVAGESDEFDWKELAVVKWTAQLAFEGCQTNKFEFRPSLDLDVAKDSFTCGFLLHKFSFLEESLNAEFPHRSVQEFFAAVHCYNLSSMTDQTKRNSVMEEINTDGQVGRFFFGLCSVDRKKFEGMLDWLNLTFCETEVFSGSNLIDLRRLSKFLCDCSQAELLGQRLAASLDQLENQIQKDRQQIFWIAYLKLPLWNRTFQSGLNLNGTVNYWSISHVDKPIWSRLTCVHGDLHFDLWQKFQKIQIFIWCCDYNQLAEQISSVDQLPEVSTLIIWVGFDLEVNFNLEYETTKTTAPTSATKQLSHFCFRFSKSRKEFLNENFKDQLDLHRLIIKSHKTYYGAEIYWVAVTVEKTSDRNHLVRMLIPLALKIYSSRSDNSDEL